MPAKLHVGDLIKTCFHNALRRHVAGHVARHRHSEPMRFCRDRLHDVGRDVVIDLHLLETRVVIASNHGHALFRCGGGDGAECLRSGSVDEAG